MSDAKRSEEHPEGRQPPRWTRRRLFKVGLATGAAAALGWHRFGRYPGAAGFEGLATLSPRAAAILASVVETMLPPAADRSPARIAAHVRAIDAYLRGADPEGEDREKVHALLYGIEHLTLPFGPRLSRFTRLDPASRARVLEGWRASRIGACRLGLRSLVALVFLAHYRDDAAFAAIGYPGPMMRGFDGPPASRARYDALLAPPGREPAWAPS